MSKRSNSGGLPPSKRRQTEDDAIRLLLDHSDDLIKCLQSLNKSKTDSFTQNKDLQALQGLSKLLLPSFKRLAGEENYQVENNEVRKKTSDETDESSTTPDQRPSSSSTGPPIPSFTLVKPWTPADIPTSLPPLPQISNPVLELAAFTHVGMVKNKGGLSYDRLEWLGDAYVELISSCLIFQTFGGMPTGKCSQLRELLVRNANLGEYSTHYKLMDRANLPAEYRPNANLAIMAKPHEVKKVSGDLFEAYVAAVILSDPAHGLVRAAEWLKALWATTIKDQIRSTAKTPDIQAVKELSESVSQESSIPPKVRLSQIIGAKGIIIRYEDIPNANKKDKYNKKLALFTVGVFLDGWGEKNKLLGTGSDLNKKEAGQKAAQMALNNKKLMKVFEDRKRAFLAALGETEAKSE
ncbi:hypothetical protein EsH8_II_000064 [Colletotrichum jinshuiense]